VLLIEPLRNLVFADGINAAKLFQLFVKICIVAIDRPISNIFYNSQNRSY
jgi:hypothetical protein